MNEFAEVMELYQIVGDGAFSTTSLFDIVADYIGIIDYRRKCAMHVFQVNEQ